MSKAFTKESEGAEEPLALDLPPLPAGVPNYVTPEGMRRLAAELERLGTEAHRDPSRRPAIERRLDALARRIEAAEVVDPQSQPQDRVLFGAKVTVRDELGIERSYRIVGVDEADARVGRVSFLSPIARALLQARVGDAVVLHRPDGDEELEVIRIAYDE